MQYAYNTHEYTISEPIQNDTHKYSTIHVLCSNTVKYSQIRVSIENTPTFDRKHHLSRTGPVPVVPVVPVPVPVGGGRPVVVGVCMQVITNIPGHRPVVATLGSGLSLYI